MKSIRKTAVGISMSAYLFLAIFLPNLFPVQTTYVVLAISLAIICIGCLAGIKLNLNTISTIYLGFMPFFGYYILAQLVRMFIESYKAEIFVTYLRSIGLVFLYSVVIVSSLLVLKELFKIDNTSYLKFFIIVMAIQLICVVVSFNVPAVRESFLKLTLNNTDSALNYQATLRNLNTGVRGYGLASSLFDSFGYIVSMLIVITFAYGLDNNNIIVLILSFAMLFVPLLNARTGLLLSFFGMLLILYYYHDIRNMLLLLVVCIMLFFVLPNVISILPLQTQDWVLRGINETTLLMRSGETTGTYSVILGSDIRWPNNMFFGEGGFPQAVSNAGIIDNGYFNSVWCYGIFGLALLLFGYIRMFVVAYRLVDAKLEKCVIMIIGIIFFIYMIKLYGIANLGANTVLFGIPAIVITSSQKDTNVS